ncbi:MAG: hypothetical protein AB1430_20825, partial [Pseudomonadota bacterium]
LPRHAVAPVVQRLRDGEITNDNVYVYRVSEQPRAYKGKSRNTESFSFDQIDGWGRVAAGTNTVRWYGRTMPGEGLRGMLPQREMGAAMGLESARPRQAAAQPRDTWFVVSNRSPQEVAAAGGLHEVPRGYAKFTLPDKESTPTLPGGWSRGKIIKHQVGLALVAFGGIAVANTISPLDTGHDVPTGEPGMPPNPISGSQFAGLDAGAFGAAPRELSTNARIALATAVERQAAADRARMVPNADPKAVKPLQDQADAWWAKFSAAATKTIQDDVAAGGSAVASANRLRAQLIAMDRFDAHADKAVLAALRDSGQVRGDARDFEAGIEYAKLVAEHKAFVNDGAHRELAHDDPVAFAAASLIESGPMDAAFHTRVRDNAARVGREYSAERIRTLLDKGDVAGAAREATLRLDAAADATQRAATRDALAPLFEEETGRGLAYLDSARPDQVGDYLSQWRGAAPELAEPLAERVSQKLRDGHWKQQLGLAGSAAYPSFFRGVATIAQAADSRSAEPKWSQRLAGDMVTGGLMERQEFRLQLARSVSQAVESGQAKLPVALANALQGKEPAFLRDSVLSGIDSGLQAQRKHLGDALGNLRGTAGYNAAGASMMFYLAHFADDTPQARAQAAEDFRRVNPGVADRMDESTRVISEWGMHLYNARIDLERLEGKPTGSEAARRLDKTYGELFGADDKTGKPNDAEVDDAMRQSPALKRLMASRVRQDVPDPRTAVEYLANPVMFVTRHISGTTRMTWTLLAEAEFNAMLADPTGFTRRWEAFKGKSARMAASLGVSADEIQRGNQVVDDYLAKVRALDSTLPEAKRLQELARLGTELDGEIKRITGIGAKTIHNVANAHTVFGQTLRWVANAGFVTHNISTEITNLRPMLQDGVQDYTKWYHRIYAPTQAFFYAKPFTSASEMPSNVARRLEAGKPADIESLLKWKFFFGAGALGVGIADTSLGIGQQGTVPNWVTFVNYGMGVSGIVDGGVTLVNATGAALTRAGAVELGALLAIPGEIATIGGLGVALFTGIKQFYNIRHHYDQVDAREASRDPALRNMLLARGFTEQQTEALLDCTHEGVSPMQGYNRMLAKYGISVEQGLDWLQTHLEDQPGEEGAKLKEWTQQVHRFTDRHMDDDNGSFPGTDPTARQAGTWHTVTKTYPGAHGGAATVQVRERRDAESLEGLYQWMTRTYGPLPRPLTYGPPAPDPATAPAPTPAPTPAPATPQLPATVPARGGYWQVTESLIDQHGQAFLDKMLDPAAQQRAREAGGRAALTDAAWRELMARNGHDPALADGQRSRSRRDPDNLSGSDTLRLDKP